MNSNIKKHEWPDLSMPKFGEWLPIESAPKDGSSIILGDKFNQTTYFAAWLPSDLHGNDTWITVWSGQTIKNIPTHWMPWPEAPK